MTGRRRTWKFELEFKLGKESMAESRAIWKFPFHVADESVIMMPRGAQLLGVDRDPAGGDLGQLAVWAIVDPGREEVERRILVRGTGHPLAGASPLRYVGSVAQELVWHVFDGGEQ